MYLNYIVHGRNFNFFKRDIKTLEDVHLYEPMRFEDGYLCERMRFEDGYLCERMRFEDGYLCERIKI